MPPAGGGSGRGDTRTRRRTGGPTGSPRGHGALVGRRKSRGTHVFPDPPVLRSGRRIAGSDGRNPEDISRGRDPGPFLSPVGTGSPAAPVLESPSAPPTHAVSRIPSTISRNSSSPR